MANGKGGRPSSKRTPEHEIKVLEALRLGVSLEQAALYAGMHYDTLNEWRKADAEFADRCKSARAELEVASLKVISEAGDKSWQARAWMLERMFPDRYGRRMVLAGDSEADPIRIDGDLRVAGAVRSSRKATAQLHQAIATAAGTSKK